MTVGIIPNTTKDQIIEVVESLIYKLHQLGIQHFLSNGILKLNFGNKPFIKGSTFMSDEEIGKNADIIISIGGDGTMLSTAYTVRESNTPMLGLNLGKLGFLAEADIDDLDNILADIKNRNFTIDQRMALEAYTEALGEDHLFAINDLVIDKGRWPKMITLTIKIDNSYVSTFSADGVIIATPTGSTGYSLSAGGPIVSPGSGVILLSPISPHTLTMRPLIVSSDKKISITVDSPYSSVQVNCDGQRVHYYEPPFTIEVSKREKPIKLVHTKKNYFEVLRNKLLWGLDVRNNILKG